ncbi:hypothetical protein J6590_075680 [Homalodisca vitripennis]|nr:hypothetical protein J6590_075680 [Homalodisca vitripennis]
MRLPADVIDITAVERENIIESNQYTYVTDQWTIVSRISCLLYTHQPITTVDLSIAHLESDCTLAQCTLSPAWGTLATADHTYSTLSALDWQSLPERLCSRTPASTVLYRTGHSVMNYSFAVVLCVSESVKDIFRLHACLQDSSLFPHFLISTWPSTTADYVALLNRASKILFHGSHNQNPFFSMFLIEPALVHQSILC